MFVTVDIDIITVRSLPLLVPNVELVVCTVPKMEAGTLGAAGKETRTPVLTNERSAQRLNRVRCGSTDVRDQPVVPSHSESVVLLTHHRRIFTTVWKIR